jgi:DNA polymerase-1
VNGRIVSNCQYRTSWATLIRVARTGYKLTLSDTEARALYDAYRETYPGVVDYWTMQSNKARLCGWVETVAGRRVHVGTGDKWTRIRVREVKGDTIEEIVTNTWNAESTAINFPVQASGADQKYLALKIARDYLPQVDGKFYYELHDGLFFIVPNKYTEKALRDLKYLLSNLPYEKAWGVKLPIQFPVDAKYGPTWGQLKEWLE